MNRVTRDLVVPHGQRYRVFEPVATVEPGETIVVETINHMTPVVQSEADLHDHGSEGYQERRETGPIAVKGAEPGDMLSIRIEKIEIVGIPHAKGWGPLGGRYPQKPVLFPVTGDRVEIAGGLTVPLAPMVGDIYTTPYSPAGNFHDHGGNMDFAEIRPGNTLYLPVFHPGGLLVLGDVHAAMGDGEIYGEGAETAADVTITLDIDRTYRHPRPLVETPDTLYSIACRGKFANSLNLAVTDMTELIARLYEVERADAYRVATLPGSARNAGCLNYAGKPIEEWSIIALGVPKDIRKSI
jgi:amidase